MSHLHNNRKILNRISRLQGQMNAMYSCVAESEAECMEVLQQVAAIRGAVNGLMNELLEEHLRHHVLSDNQNEQELAEFLLLLKKYNR